MEAVHCPEEKHWISDVVNLRDFLNGWSQQLMDSEFNVDSWRSLSSANKTDDTHEKNLFEELYGPQMLTVPRESGTTSLRDVPDDIDLLTLKLQKEDLERRKSDKAYHNMLRQLFCRANYPSTKVDRKLSAYATVRDPDVVLTLQLFRPMSHMIRQVQKRSPLTFIIDQQMSVLGCQKLTEIRDYICCVSDVTIPGDFSENPDQQPVTRAKDLYKSGFFYIHDTFYNDMRDSANIDYSEVIINWAKDPSRGIGSFKKKLMEETRLIDLELRLGYPYLYMHQGNCEHLMVFSDLRLLSATDSHDLKDYPLFQTVFSKRAVHCMMCDTQVAKWLTEKNNRLPCDPFFFCDNCFRLFNYTSQGDKIGEFEARHYFDRTSVM